MNWVGCKLKAVVNGLTIGPEPTPIRTGTIIGMCVKHNENNKEILCKLLSQYKGWKDAMIAIECGCAPDSEFWWLDERYVSPVASALMNTE